MEDLGDERLLNAYNKLIPTAYKADLWRYSILRKYGGIYIDSTHRALIPYNDIIKDRKEIFVKDIYDYGIYNAFICTTANNEILEKVIELSIYNIENEIYGKNVLSITGCQLLGIAYNSLNDKDHYEEIKINNSISLEHEIVDEDIINTNIKDNKNKYVIRCRDIKDYYIKIYNNNCLNDEKPNTHYSVLYENKTVFKNERWVSINNLYKKVLKREGDLEGLSHYYTNDFNVQQIEQILLESTEYKNNHNDQNL
jgi:hypothetical protein